MATLFFDQHSHRMREDAAEGPAEQMVRAVGLYTPDLRDVACGRRLYGPWWLGVVGPGYLDAVDRPILWQMLHQRSITPGQSDDRVYAEERCCRAGAADRQHHVEGGVVLNGIGQVDPSGQRHRGGVGEQPLQLDSSAQLLTDRADHGDGRQGVAAECEEVIVHADLLSFE